MPPLENILQFPNPATPDLGCFVRRKHEFQTDPDVDFLNVHVEFNPSIDFSPSHHQTYFRVMCGEAAFFQRGLVYMTPNAQIPPPVLQNFPPDFVLGGDHTPRPSDWNRYPTQTGERFYWFFGQHRNPATTTWQADALVGHSYDIYENGTLSIVRYDDTGGDRDFDDFVLEVAIVGRRSFAARCTQGKCSNSSLFYSGRYGQKPLLTPFHLRLNAGGSALINFENLA